MLNLLSSITNFIIHIISAWGYAGVVFLMAVESAAIPLPSEVIAPFAGFLAEQGRFNLFYIAIAGGLGSAVGSAITYWIGYKLGRPLVEKYGKYILISPHDLNMADKFFTKYGELSTFIGRLLPVVRTFISIPAGIEKIPFWKFIFYSFLGSAIWTYALAFIGFKLGKNWENIHNQFRGLDIIIITIIIIAAAWWIYRHVKHIRNAHRN